MNNKNAFTQFNHAGVSLNYRLDKTESQNPPMIFLPGWGFGARMGEVALQPFKNDYLTLIIDFPGTGQLADHSAFAYIPRLSAAVAALLRELQLNEAIVFGHSFGTLVAQDLALREDDVVGKLILISPLLGAGTGALTGADLNTAMSVLNQLLSGETTVWEALYPPAYLQDLKETLGSVFEDLARPTSVSALSGQVWAASRWSHFGRLTQLYQSTHIIQGQDDPLGSVFQAKQLARQIPNATLEILKCGYLPFVEDPKAFAKSVKTAL